MSRAGFRAPSPRAGAGCRDEAKLVQPMTRGSVWRRTPFSVRRWAAGRYRSRALPQVIQPGGSIRDDEVIKPPTTPGSHGVHRVRHFGIDVSRGLSTTKSSYPAEAGIQ